MPASSARGAPSAAAPSRARRRASTLALAVGLGMLACALLLGVGIAWARPVAAAVAGVNIAATATAAAHTPTAAPTVAPTPVPAPTPVTLTSNGLVLYTTLGCIIGVIGLLAFGIAWITLLSDGWGPMLKAMILGNRRGRMRFTRTARNSRKRQPDPWDRRTPGAGTPAGWR